jgi:4'-phosphopantetheinyl transferase EntD
MTRPFDLELAAALHAAAPQGVLVGHRVISDGDEEALSPELFPLPTLKRKRRESGAARMVARSLLAQLGCEDFPLRALPSGAPGWPPGIIGSLAHDRTVAIAAVARAKDLRALGVDVEPLLPLPAGLIEIVATPEERRRYSNEILESRLLFAAKEAVYKAINAFDASELDFEHVFVDFAAQTATIPDGRQIRVITSSAPCILALAYV